MTDDDRQKVLGRIVAKAWADEGIDLPAGQTLRVVGNIDTVTRRVLPRSGAMSPPTTRWTPFRGAGARS